MKGCENMGILTLMSNASLDEVEAYVHGMLSDISKTRPEFISKSGDGDFVSTVMEADIVIQPILSAAGCQKLPFMLLPRSDIVPERGHYDLRIEFKFCNDNPFCKNAKCTNKEFMKVFAMAFKLFGFLSVPTDDKTQELILFERDCCLLYTYLYFNLDYSEISKVA